MITLPTNMSLQDWADQIVLDLEGQIPAVPLENPDMWQPWAARYMELPSVDGRMIPNPYFYSDWREWAERLCEVLN